MGLLKHIRSKSRMKHADNDASKSTNPHGGDGGHNPKYSSAWSKPDPTAKLPLALLEELLSYVCPPDDSYDSYEESMTDAGCILCDVRDLAQCCLVSQQWSRVARNLLYRNIRIEAVHYCDREAELTTRRKRRSFTGRNLESRDSPKERLQLLSRTVRENHDLAHRVQYLKLPYMTREGNVADLARTVSVLTNLFYVDLPEGCYHDEPSCSLLKQELQSRCPRIRQMRYCKGSEGSFRLLIQSGQWEDLDSLGLSHLALEQDAIVAVVSSLSNLHKLRVEDMYLLDDRMFEPALMVTFPPLTELTLQGIPNVSAQGLVAYLSQPNLQESLTHLHLADTGVSASDLYRILLAATSLTHLHIATTVSRGLLSSQLPPLASQSLRNFHYEIINASVSPGSPSSPSDSYYTYLSSSILGGSLPSLTHLYALSDTPQELLQPGRQPSFLENCNGTVPPSLSLGLARPLHLYTKAIRELEWNLTLISPPSPAHHRGNITNTRPESLYHAAPLSPQYRNTGRQSVIVGNGFGGFLTVPSPGFPPGSPGSKHKTTDMDAWMG